MQHRMTLSRYERRPPPPRSEYDDSHHRWAKGNKIPVYEGGLDKAMNKLKRMMLKEGLYEDMRRHERYIKPSEQRRMRKAEGIKKWRKREQKLREDMIIAPHPQKPVHRKGK